MKHIISFLFFIFIFRKSSACSGLQNRRTCVCSTYYVIKDVQESMKSLNLPLGSYDDCGVNLGCEKENDCSIFCAKQIRQLLGKNEFIITQQANDNVCSLIFPNQQSLNKNGIYLWSSWQYSKCKNGTELLIKDLCCNSRCNCQLIGQNMINDNQEVLVDFKSSLPPNQISYNCFNTEFEKCESDCRHLVSKELQNNNILTNTKMIPNYNVFKSTESNKPAGIEYASEYVCERYGKNLGRPGYDTFLKIYSDEKTEKYLPFGRLCCQRKCNCIVYYQDPTNIPSTNEKGKVLIDLTNLIYDLYAKKAYNCQNEITSCMSDCRDAFGRWSQSDYLIDPSQSELKELETSNVNIFNQPTPGVRVCEKIGNEVAKPGLNFYLRYSAEADDKFPYREELDLGTLCCFPYDGKLVPFNKCINYPDP